MLHCRQPHRLWKSSKTWETSRATGCPGVQNVLGPRAVWMRGRSFFGGDDGCLNVFCVHKSLNNLKSTIQSY